MELAIGAFTWLNEEKFECHLYYCDFDNAI